MVPSKLQNQVAVSIVILGVGIGGFFFLKSMKAETAREELPDARPLVGTEVLTEDVAEFEIHVDGVVEPKREVTVAAEVGGQVIEKTPFCDSGNYVVADTLLLKIDPRKYELEVERLEGMVKQTVVDLQQLDLEGSNNLALIDIAERDLELKNRDLARIKGLFDKGATTEAELDRAEGDALKTQNALQQLQNNRTLLPSRKERAEAERSLVQTQLAGAKLDLQKTVIHAPINGVITDDPVEAKQYVAAGTPLVVVQDMTAVEVRCSLRLRDLYWLWNSVGRPTGESAESGRPYFEVPPADAVVTYTLGERTYQWKGRLSRYEGVGIDVATRTMPCLIEVSSPRREGASDGPPALIRGMFVSVELHVAPKTPLMRIPIAALQPNNSVWSVKDGKLHRHQVQIAKLLDDSALVAADSTKLRPGDRLVVTPLPVAFDGMDVREQDDP